MKLGKLLMTVGKGVIREAVPGGGAIVELINAIVGPGKVDSTATGEQALEAIKGLPPSTQTTLLNRDLDIEEALIGQRYETARTMLEVEARSTHTTRPKIALGAFRVVAYAVVLIVTIWAVAVLRDDAAMVRTVMDGWPFLLSVLAPFVGLLDRYFGKLRDEHRNRLAAAKGDTLSSGVAQAISAIFKRGK